ncbi:MAG: UDP-glucose/GDP-mannose dehydrogenase family protein [Bacillaceae bacterium]|nr:UDP-glucose/GDP-mannose dehydrogenase family protein [Bacillaceae bacterium]
MKKITIVGTGYVGLVTGVCLAEMGHDVTCIDNDQEKLNKMKAGKSPIYEPGLEDLMKKNLESGRLHFTSNYKEGFLEAEVIYIAVGTPQKPDGSADLQYIDQVAREIALHISHPVTVVIKSTVPVGTNYRVREMLKTLLNEKIQVDIVSNPEFLREGSAVYDTFHGDRIVVGVDREEAFNTMEEIYKPFKVPIFKTDVLSAEMIKYASNAFLATKISFINEIANICEKLGANVEDVAYGMGLDDRIGSKFLRAGIGYGGSCFPKDTQALVQIAGNVHHKFDLLESVINVNNNQQKALVDKVKQRLGSLKGKRVALLGLAFKPNTDDMREAASIVISNQLIDEGAEIKAYDPIAIENAKKFLHPDVSYSTSIEEAVNNADLAMIITEWDEIKNFPLQKYEELMKNPLVFDGRNCYSLDAVQQTGVEYHSIGRPSVNVANFAGMSNQ